MAPDDTFERMWTGDWKAVAEEATAGQINSDNWVKAQAVFQGRVAQAQDRAALAQDETARLTRLLAVATVALAVATFVLAVATVVLVIVTAQADDESASQPVALLDS